MARLARYIQAVAAAFTLAAPACAEELVALPSGQMVTFLDTIWQGEGPVIRFRFLAPQIGPEGGNVEFIQVEQDMLYLCESFALPKIAQSGLKPAQVIISLSDKPVSFGETNSEIVQFFEGYRPEGDVCAWEGM